MGVAKLLLLVGGMLFADQYIQIATLLPSDKIYGFGENIHKNLKVTIASYFLSGQFVEKRRQA